MTLLDFLAELIAEAKGTTIEHERTNLRTHTAHDHHPILEQEVSAEMVAKGRALIKSDPEGFRHKMASGAMNWLTGTTKH